MFRAKIKLVYKQDINSEPESAFEKAIFKSSYAEFQLKSQVYNLSGRYKTFSSMRENDGRANSLHYKLSFSVLHFISQLNNKIPLLTDTMGKRISFETPRFELIESHVEDSSLHKAVIYYETAAVTLVEFLGEYLLLTNDCKAENEEIETFMLRMQPNLGVMSYQGITHPQLAWMES